MFKNVCIVSCYLLEILVTNAFIGHVIIFLENVIFICLNCK
jgi:hypothetical protein